MDTKQVREFLIRLARAKAQVVDRGLIPVVVVLHPLTMTDVIENMQEFSPHFQSEIHEGKLRYFLMGLPVVERPEVTDGMVVVLGDREILR